MVLHGAETRPAVSFGGVLGFGELPGPHRRSADVQCLSRLDHVVQRLHGDLDRGHRVPPVDLVEVDVVGAEPAQAVVDLGHDRLAGQPHTVRPASGPSIDLAGQDDFVTTAVFAEDLADDPLAAPGGVDVRGVHEVHPGLQGVQHHRPGLVEVQGPAVDTLAGCSETQGAQADSRHVHAGRAQLDVLQDVPPTTGSVAERTTLHGGKAVDFPASVRPTVADIPAPPA